MKNLGAVCSILLKNSELPSSATDSVHAKRDICNILKRKREDQSDIIVGFKHILEKLLRDPLSPPITKELCNSILTSVDMGTLIQKILYSDFIIICPVLLIDSATILIKKQFVDRDCLIMSDIPNLPYSDYDSKRAQLACSTLFSLKKSLASSGSHNQKIVYISIGFVKTRTVPVRSMMVFKSMEVLEEPGLLLTGFLLLTFWAYDTEAQSLLPKKCYQFHTPGTMKYCSLHKMVEFDQSLLLPPCKECLNKDGFHSVFQSREFLIELAAALNSVF